ncbi:hypothetical protein VTO42DRAFT_3461 [Malbranchea cinnamomea]
MTEKDVMSEAPIVSHGRGGTGNIGPDSTKYVDANIVRKGPEGDQGDGAYSAGRGGIGNIGSPHVRPTSSQVHDADVIPEMTIRPSLDTDHHTGRGGQGNVEKVKSREGTATPEKTSAPITAPEGLADKLKYKIFGRK